MSTSKRPYIHQMSKSGLARTIDTRIKRKTVKEAIEKLNFKQDASIPRVERVTKAGPSNARIASDALLRLPGEVRNRIYQFVLGTGTPNEPTLRVPTPRHLSSPEKFRDGGLHLLQSCRQISVEARTLMETTDTAYIPVMGHIAYENRIANIVEKAPCYVSREDHTMLAGLASFMKVHIHLHTRYSTAANSNDPEPYLDISCAYLYRRLRQIPIFHISASPILAQRWPGKKRHAVVHLDHFRSDWVHMVSLRGPYTMKLIARLMGEDTHTNWELRYYVHTANEEREQTHWSNWDEEAVRELDFLVGVCKPFGNIKVVAEVYGELKWSVEGVREEVTRNITPSSVNYPSWPDDVPWRKE